MEGRNDDGLRRIKSCNVNRAHTISKVTETITKDLVKAKIKNLHKTLIEIFRLKNQKLQFIY